VRRFRIPNKSQITESSIRELWRKIRVSIGSREGSSLSAVLDRVVKSIELFFSRLGKPKFQHREIQPEDPPDPMRFGSMTEDIASDLSTGYGEIDALRGMTISTHNYGAMKAAELKRRADRVASQVADLRILSGQQRQEALVFSDNFTDDSKIDSSFPTEHMEAQTWPGQGILMLHRDAVLVVAPEEVDIEVKPLSPPDLSREPSRTNVDRFYEGHFYSFLGEAEPEGGTFHLVEKLDTEALGNYTQEAMTIPEPTGKLKKDGTRKYTRKDLANYVVPGGFEAKFLEQVQSGVYADKTGKKLVRFVRRKRKRYHRKDRQLRRSAVYFYQHPDEGEPPSPDAPITPENLIVVDQGATEGELLEIRRKMIDGNPGSYWQCEFVRKTEAFSDFIESSLDEESRALVSPAELRDISSSTKVDNADFEVEIVMTLANPIILNWITLNPMNFDENAWLEVTDVSTAPDFESDFTQVESFIDQTSPNILTDEANEEISLDTARAILAPNRSSYRGVGVWPFAARRVRSIRIRLRQKTPVPNPYEIIVLAASRSHTTLPARRRLL